MKIQNGYSLKPPSPEAKAAQQDANLKDASKMYEKYFLNEMVKAMRSTVNPEEGFIKPSFAEKIFTEQLDQQYVDNWSEKGGVGLSQLIYSQIKDQYYGASQKQIQQLHPVLPIAPKREIQLPATDSIQMKVIPPANGAKLSYRFEVPSPAQDGFEVQAPLAGRIVEATKLDQGWNMIRLDHGQGLRSEMTFPGLVTQNGVGQELTAGQRLGLLDRERPVVAWNLDWS